MSVEDLTDPELEAVRSMVRWLEDDDQDPDAFPVNMTDPVLFQAVIKLCRNEEARRRESTIARVATLRPTGMVRLFLRAHLETLEAWPPGRPADYLPDLSIGESSIEDHVEAVAKRFRELLLGHASHGGQLDG